MMSEDDSDNESFFRCWPVGGADRERGTQGGKGQGTEMMTEITYHVMVDKGIQKGATMK